MANPIQIPLSRRDVVAGLTATSVAALLAPRAIQTTRPTTPMARS